MKKHFLFLAMAVAAMTGCMKDEVVATYEPTPQAIGFESFVNKATKGVTETTNDITKFYVSAFYLNNGTQDNVFIKEAVTKDGSAWEYDVATKYWTNNTYYFAAYAQGDNLDMPSTTLEYTSSKPTFTIPNWTIPYTTAADSKTTSTATDLVADFNSEAGTTDRTAKVDITFQHLLSKVKFTVENTDSKGFTMNITNLTLSNVKNTGNFLSNSPNETFTVSNWNTTGSAVNNFIPIPKATGMVKNETRVSDVLYVLPQALADVEFSITAEFYDGDDLVYTKTVGGTISRNTYDSWQPGYSYEYTIQLPSSAQPIEFGTASVNGWETVTGIELNSL